MFKRQWAAFLLDTLDQYNNIAITTIKGVRNVAIMITDGNSTKFAEKTIPAANAIHRANIDLFVVGVTKNVDVNEIRQMSSPPHIKG